MTRKERKELKELLLDLAEKHFHDGRLQLAAQIAQKKVTLARLVREQKENKKIISRLIPNHQGKSLEEQRWLNDKLDQKRARARDIRHLHEDLGSLKVLLAHRRATDQQSNYIGKIKNILNIKD